MLNKEMLFKYDYILFWKDTPVIKFNPNRRVAEVINKNLLPYTCFNTNSPYEMITSFCSNRVLMTNRKYCKEILTSCLIDNQTDIGINLIGMGLSFRDNYWIRKARSNETWGSVNLYNNKFSNKIAKVALTGEPEVIDINDDFYTGELTGKGTRAKCFVRDETSHIFLYKNETRSEIDSEILAVAIGVPCSPYKFDILFNTFCSTCQIMTNEDIEMIPFRDILEYCNNNQQTAYNFFVNVDAYNFTLMQIFDYITLNTDRNRDNYGLLRYKGNLVSLYPLFDHDSCFKGKNANGVYFPTKITFA